MRNLILGLLMGVGLFGGMAHGYEGGWDPGRLGPPPTCQVEPDCTFTDVCPGTMKCYGPSSMRWYCCLNNPFDQGLLAEDPGADAVREFREVRILGVR